MTRRAADVRGCTCPAHSAGRSCPVCGAWSDLAAVLTSCRTGAGFGAQRYRAARRRLVPRRRASVDALIARLERRLAEVERDLQALDWRCADLEEGAAARAENGRGVCP